MDLATMTRRAESRELAEGSSLRAQQTRSRAGTTLDPAIAKRAAEMPRKYRPAYLKAAGGTASPRTAIKAFCLECVGWQREEVARCTAPACPLYAYRPFQR
jgi:hypothetical protein